jgi:hypothetical protein
MIGVVMTAPVPLLACRRSGNLVVSSNPIASPFEVSPIVSLSVRLNLIHIS